jgi:hypothetical protein
MPNPSDEACRLCEGHLGFLLFVRNADNSAIKSFLARILLSRMVCRLLRGVILIMTARGAWRDHHAAKLK